MFDPLINISVLIGDLFTAKHPLLLVLRVKVDSSVVKTILTLRSLFLFLMFLIFIQHRKLKVNNLSKNAIAFCRCFSSEPCLYQQKDFIG